MTLDDLIYALTIHRDNLGSGTAHVTFHAGTKELPINRIGVQRFNGHFGEGVGISLGMSDRYVAPNHDREIPAREADDLRKLAHHTKQFRHAVVEFSTQKYLPHDESDPDRFKRTRKQMIETGRDICLTLGHIELECAR